ncbi:MAG: bifunctional UDP-sugar hydrolase/5'-nucleotidase [Eubacteriales bacterium]|nr:bifunctional UDP-sugar hydrolase/5'-nucleotidase [Eubacteriales bacterium]
MKQTKVILSLILSLILLLSIPAIGATAEEPEANIKELIILHTNDTHGRVVGDSVPGPDGLPREAGIIGFARYKTMIDAIKKANDDRVLVLDAGDTIHGTNFATLSKGQSVIRVMNEVGIDAMVAGNHEYNYGMKELDDAIKEANFPVLAANIVDEKSGEKPLQSHEIFEIDGLKIGVFGIATPETKVKSSPPNTEGLDFVDPVKVAAEEVEALKKEGCHAIIMLCHLGIDLESVDTSRKVLEEVEGIDLAVDGHSHTLIESGEELGSALLVQAGEMFGHVGLVRLKFEDDKLVEKEAQTIDFKSAAQYQEDPDILEYIASIEKENERYTKLEVGKTAVHLDGEREDVRTSETNLSNLIVDAILWATEADCAISNGGNVRASIPEGMITMGDLLTVMPFENTIIVIEVSGKDIKDALKFGADAYPGTAGKFPNVANLTYEIVKVDKDKYEVQNILYQGKELDDEKIYKLATNDFLAIGGDGYTMFEDKPQVLLQGLMVDIVRDYIEYLIADGEDFEYETDGRIKVVED